MEDRRFDIPDIAGVFEGLSRKERWSTDYFVSRSSTYRTRFWLDGYANTRVICSALYSYLVILPRLCPVLQIQYLGIVQWSKIVRLSEVIGSVTRSTSRY